MYDIEKQSLHSMLTDDSFKFDNRLLNMNLATITQMPTKNREYLKPYFEKSLRRNKNISNNYLFF